MDTVLPKRMEGNTWIIYWESERLIEIPLLETNMNKNWE